MLRMLSGGMHAGSVDAGADTQVPPVKLHNDSARSTFNCTTFASDVKLDPASAKSRIAPWHFLELFQLRLNV